jgi:hypothetical protein
VSIGEQFPEHARKAFAQENIRAGVVVRRTVTETNKPKIKRCVVLGISDDLTSVGVLFINSEINFNIIATKELQELQFEVTTTGREYLDHDSFVDCSQLFEQSYMNLLKEAQSEPGIILGRVSRAELDTIINLAKRSRKISPKLKKKYHIAL